jgi:hypothetical protein
VTFPEALVVMMGCGKMQTAEGGRAGCSANIKKLAQDILLHNLLVLGELASPMGCLPFLSCKASNAVYLV